MYVKYPKTYHLPWSESVARDDKILKDPTFLKGNVVVTEKMDGENTTIYRDYIHARSIDSKNHESRHWVKAFAASFQHNIPEGWRICGENLYAKHSIHYNNLLSYFYGFAVFDNRNMCLSWEDTVDIFNELGITAVPVLYKGNNVSEEFLKDLAGSIDTEHQEGYVVRNSDSFHFDDFKYNVAKYVRSNHVNTGDHWMYEQIHCNKLVS